ncbi:excalibur calcium-binding domain-containing protein [Pseudomonas sp. QL9]|uniref:excalibur calcium-binding domain-containing protein n=1 Tax=Pseudomonas TaxID=286 RepID=UPI00352A8013
MKKWILLIAVAVLAWQYMDNPAWQERFSGSRATTESVSQEDASEPTDQMLPASPPPAVASPASSPVAVTCDGRQYCSQMHSCEEAKAFLRNCPGMKMDGDRDGVPCEEQWCR